MLTLQTSQKEFTNNLFRQLIYPSDIVVLDRMGFGLFVDVLRKACIVDAVIVESHHRASKDFIETIWSDGVVQFSVPTTGSFERIALSDEESIDKVFHEMRCQGLVFEKESVKSISTILGTNPLLGKR